MLALPSFPFKLVREVLTGGLISLLRNIWIKNCIPLFWSESMIVSIFGKWLHNNFSNHHGIILIPIVAKALAVVILRPLTIILENDVREKQSGFHPGRDCVDLSCSGHRQPTILAFLSIRAAFDLVDRTALFSALHWKCMPKKFANLLRESWSHVFGRPRIRRGSSSYIGCKQPNSE